MNIEEVWTDEWVVAYTKGHVDKAPFLEAVEDSCEWYDADNDEDAVHDYARKIPGEWEGIKCILTWFHRKPGRGAFKITRTEIP